MLPSERFSLLSWVKIRRYNLGSCAGFSFLLNLLF